MKEGGAVNIERLYLSLAVGCVALFLPYLSVWRAMVFLDVFYGVYVLSTAMVCYFALGVVFENFVPAKMVILCRILAGFLSVPFAWVMSLLPWLVVPKLMAGFERVFGLPPEYCRFAVFSAVLICGFMAAIRWRHLRTQRLEVTNDAVG